MKKHTSNILIILLLTLMVIGCFHDKGTITGRVTDYDNKAVSGVSVVAEPHGFTTTTDENGDYTIEPVPLGDYTLTVSSGDFGGWAQASVKGESFLGCEDINISPEIRVEANIQFSLSSFPLKIGNYWEYEYDSKIGTSISTDTVKRLITGTQDISGVTCYAVQDDFIIDDQNYTDINYFAIVNNELRNYGYESGGVGSWLPTSVSMQSENKHDFGTNIIFDVGDITYFINEDMFSGSSKFRIQDIVPYYTPYKLLVFPLFINNAWYYTRDTFTIMRKVIANETITVPAGTFYCTKVQHIYSDIDDMEIYMWYSPIGLVKSTLWSEFEGTEGTFEVYQTYELQSYTLD